MGRAIFFLTYVLFTWKLHAHTFIPPKATTTRFGLHWSQDPGCTSGSPSWVQGPKPLGHFSLPSWALEQGAGQKRGWGQDFTEAHVGFWHFGTRSSYYIQLFKDLFIYFQSQSSEKEGLRDICILCFTPQMAVMASDGPGQNQESGVLSESAIWVAEAHIFKQFSRLLEARWIRNLVAGAPTGAH